MSTILPPNSSICVFGNSGSISAHLFPGIWTPTSEHPGGVQIAMSDGSTRFINNNIDTGNLAFRVSGDVQLLVACSTACRS
jgi:hypothetical protein